MERNEIRRREYIYVYMQSARVIVENSFEDAIKRAHERAIMKNAFNDERLDRWRGVLHGENE